MIKLHLMFVQDGEGAEHNLPLHTLLVADLKLRIGANEDAGGEWSWGLHNLQDLLPLKLQGSFVSTLEKQARGRRLVLSAKAN